MKFGFYPSKLKKTFFAEHFKIQGEALTLPAPPFRRPWSCMRVIVNPCCCEISQFSTWFRRVWEVIFLHWNKQKMGSYLQSVCPECSTTKQLVYWYWTKVAVISKFLYACCHGDGASANGWRRSSVRRAIKICKMSVCLWPQGHPETASVIRFVLSPTWSCQLWLCFVTSCVKAQCDIWNCGQQ